MGNQMNEKNIEKMFKDFDVNTEDELFNKLIEDSKTLTCIVCGKTIFTEDAYFLNDEPVCRRCKLKELE